MYDLLQGTGYYGAVKYTSTAVAAILILLGLTGNSIILIGSFQYNAFRLDKVTATLIDHLAVSDLACTVVLMIPSTIATMWDSWPFGYTFCKIHFYMVLTLSHCSVCHICAMTTSKLVSIQRPFRAQLWERRNGHLLGSAVWVLSVTPAVILLIVNPNSFYYDNVRIACMYDFSDPIWTYLLPAVSFFMAGVPNMILVISTIGLIVSAWKVAKRGRESVKWQGMITVICVALVYFISYSPQVVLNLMGGKYQHPDQTDNNIKVGILICSRLILLNYVSNVFIYTISVHSFRQFLKSWVRAPTFHYRAVREMMETGV